MKKTLIIAILESTFRFRDELQKQKTVRPIKAFENIELFEKFKKEYVLDSELEQELHYVEFNAFCSKEEFRCLLDAINLLSAEQINEAHQTIW